MPNTTSTATLVFTMRRTPHSSRRLLLRADDRRGAAALRLDAAYGGAGLLREKQNLRIVHRCLVNHCHAADDFTVAALERPDTAGWNLTSNRG